MFGRSRRKPTAEELAEIRIREIVDEQIAEVLARPETALEIVKAVGENKEASLRLARLATTGSTRLHGESAKDAK